MLPRLLVTIGDPAGIGPEVILKALADPQIQTHCHLTLVGSFEILAQTYHQFQALCADRGQPLANPADFAWIDLPVPEVIPIGQATAASGAASFAYLERAIAAVLTGEFQGIVTAPIAKSAWQAAGHDYPGQTELLAEKSSTPRFGMLFVARSPHSGWCLRTLLATVHIPLRAVPDALTPALLDQKLDLLIASLNQDFGLTAPTIAIAGLNPHSGEQGHLGHEEQDWLIPWLAQAQNRHPQTKLLGPVPPDTLWVQPGQAWYGTAGTAGTLTSAPDAYLALYHDQGLIPVKLLAFDRAVNTSIGLPFVRTSPDHGTGFDIAGQGIARSESMQAAIVWAIEFAQQRFTDLK
jgi:4-hydroxythreonine-4-phosphate dehydrogenase